MDYEVLSTHLHFACSDTVAPRRPFVQDGTMDYEVLSDEEWEEEPEGEELGDVAEGDDEDDGSVDGDEDGFMVAGTCCSLSRILDDLGRSYALWQT